MELKSILPSRRVNNEEKWWKCDGVNGLSFVIEPYQRGYRWENSNVKKLLEDLRSYSKKISNGIIPFFAQECEEKEQEKMTKDYDFYCLQALSVKEIKDKEEYELIDGQQRLTTIFLIYELLYAFSDFHDMSENPPYRIIYRRGKKEVDLTDRIHGIITKLKINNTAPSKEYKKGKDKRIHKDNTWFKMYETELKREIKDIKDEDACSDSLTMDLFYLSEAAVVIVEFIRNLEDSEGIDNQIKKFFSIIKQNVLFLWYEIGDNISSEEEFSSLNTNKVKLTNAELIKALVLRKEDNTEIPENAGHRWETIEQGLCKNELWAFISGEDKATRIDLILDLFARGVNNTYVNKLPDYKTDANNEYLLFDWYEEFRQKYNDYKKENEKIDSFSNVVLQSIEEIYDRISEWYDDVDIYHLIGLLTCFNGLKLKENKNVKQEIMIKDIFVLYYDSKDREDFISKLKGKIRERIASGVIREKSDDTNSVSTEDIIDSYHYDDDGNPYIFAILWALNAWETMEAAENNISENERVPVILKRMPFSKINGKLSKDNSWTLEHIMPQTPDESEEDDSIKSYEGLKSKIKEVCADDQILKEDSEIHGIGNLALLTHSSNSKLKNKNLQLKREHIVQLIGKGEYVPCATINAFSLYYNMLNKENKDSKDNSATVKEYKVTEKEYKFWIKSDSDKYLEQIRKCLKAYGFNESNDNGTKIAEESKGEIR